MMDITLSFETIAEADNYLVLEYKNQTYKLEEFALRYVKPDDMFFLDTLLKDCILVYKGKRRTYDEMCNEINIFADSLKFSEHYRELYPIENQIFIVDRDYYAALKMLESTEKNLMYARYALLKSQCILDFNVNLHWQAGYAAIYNLRAIEATSAIMWYNTIYDTMLQIIFFAYGFYKKHKSYNQNMDFHKLLKLCDNDFLWILYNRYKNIQEFKTLWSILSKVYNATRNIRKWTNYIKHKGGLSYLGASAESPYSISIDTGKKIYDSDFNLLKLDLDDVISQMQTVHQVLVEAIGEMVEFVSFDSARLVKQGNVDIIPAPVTFKKVILP